MVWCLFPLAVAAALVFGYFTLFGFLAWLGDDHGRKKGR